MITFFLGHGSWIWLYAVLGGAFLTQAGVLWYMVLAPKGPGGGPFLAFMAYTVAWLVLLVLSTVSGILWARATQLHWMLWILVLLGLWIAVGLMWQFLFMASDPNYPHRLLPGRILFGALTTAIYRANLVMLARARAG
jgi:hypothetical protein